MKETRVSIVRAGGYDAGLIYPAVQRAVSLIGGIDKLIHPGNRVFVKINHLSPASPADRGIVTHPVFVEAVLRLLKDRRASITVGDDIESGGDGFTVSGFDDMCRRVGVDLINLKEKGFTETGCRGKFLKMVYLAKLALEADVIINLPKLKTHSLTLFTGGIKNMYGTIPSGFRVRFHGEYVRPEDFNQVLVDVFSVVRPRLTIMDGIQAMEGEGPASGSLRKLGLILASRDAVALDAVAARIIGLEPRDVYTIRYAAERKLGVADLDAIEVVGEKLKDVTVPDFKLPAGAITALTRRVPRWLTRFLLKQLPARPRVVESQCTACFECRSICPVAAVSEVAGKAEIDHSRCVGCLCCNEVCHYGAIISRRTALGSILAALAGVGKKLASRE